MSIQIGGEKGFEWWAGYEDCKDGKPSSPFGDSESVKWYESGYAARYEEEQQLTNQVEEQEK